jgi:hypothetical protein
MYRYRAEDEPVVLGGAEGDAELVRGLLDGQASEVDELDDLPLPG